MSQSKKKESLLLQELLPLTKTSSLLSAHSLCLFLDSQVPSPQPPLVLFHLRPRPPATTIGPDAEIAGRQVHCPGVREGVAGGG